ncbi:MAG: tetratricopeptide repeat protein [Desulfobacterales bacterium]|nr:tetratricopeptide repeat protein [Desulfobacterales bacterium]
MRCFFVGLVALIVLSGVPSTLVAGDHSKVFFQGVASYEEGDYQKALTGFLSIAEEGEVENGKLFYNIGNSYMQLGKTGHALLWYERALRLIPKDPDLLFNRNVALSKVKDRQEEGAGLLASLLFFWKKGLSLGTLQWLAVGVGLIFWTCLTLALWRKKGALKGGAAFCGALFVLVGGTAVWDTVALGRTHKGVVLAPSVSVHSGLSETSTELFTLHAGSFVSIEARREGWVRIAFGSAKRGWAQSESVGEI